MDRPSLDDPLSHILAPPPNESPLACQTRIRAEADARRVSDAIDEQLRSERAALKKKRRPVKLLILGQSESGKSATLKNFQLRYAAAQWTEERPAWRAVVYLNLIRSVVHILDLLVQAISASSPHSPGDLDRRTSARPHSSPTAAVFADEQIGLDSDGDPGSPTLHTSINRRAGEGEEAGPGSPVGVSLAFTDTHRLLKLRLAPLRSVLSDLERRLGPASQEVLSCAPRALPEFACAGNSPFGTGSSSRPREFAVSSTNGWRSVLNNVRSKHLRSDHRRLYHPRSDGVVAGTVAEMVTGQDEVAGVLSGCREDIIRLWQDPVIQRLLSLQPTRIEDSSGFFLDDIARIARTDYEPTDGDIVRARLRTVGVQEHRFYMDAKVATGPDATATRGVDDGREWIMYDFGGTRSSRGSWASFFDDVDALIFLSPISCFDERLLEDRRVNRLEDSLQLWKTVCSCRALARTHIILFLNKCDILNEKMKRGVRVNRHVTSFGDLRNDTMTVMKYFQQHFKEIFKTCSPNPRPFFSHFTSVIDIHSTAKTLDVVRESILRQRLQHATLI